ncbi:hypothetical protein COCVIDRAFT_107170 [Bipolaris victoriae FI3]|uniref:Uncharacterized protein n=1 Tax=Bipolaris victoriae (strain FI3) TaxID=930091 RepID=W7EDX8_BIPV3|nr:hypothetical protein COCVIDRAFT_107170 [Bipolaris victoriae FI3]
MEKPSSTLPFRQVVIVGCGFGGLVMACQLKRRLQFNDFVMYERNAGLGGTWHHNRYPGASADVFGAAYQISFAPEPKFTRAFPVWNELHGYMEKVADRYNLVPHMKFGISWEGSVWIPETRCWRVVLRDCATGDTFTQMCKVLVSATGHLVDPKQLEVQGKDIFKGKIVHSSLWTSDIDVKDKSVVVLGNGSTAVQLVPSILEDVKECTQIQRAPQWILHRPNPALPAAMLTLLTYVPLLFTVLRTTLFAITEAFFHVVGNKIPQISKNHLRKFEVPEEYYDLLTPSYRPGCKRLVFASDYLGCLKNPKLHLIQDEIASLREKSVVTRSGKEYPCDMLLLAHGFESETFKLPLTGRNGVTPQRHWAVAGGPSCYKGIAMHDFPNFFTIRGPNMASGHNSVIWYIEATVELILNVATPLIQGKVNQVEVTAEAESEYVNKVQAACRRGVWGSACNTYYVTKNGWNHTMYPWNSYSLWWFRFVNKKDWTVVV